MSKDSKVTEQRMPWFAVVLEQITRISFVRSLETEGCVEDSRRADSQGHIPEFLKNYGKLFSAGPMLEKFAVNNSQIIKPDTE